MYTVDNETEHVVIIMCFSQYVTDSNGLAGHVQSCESEKQPVDLVWALHHLHCRVSFSGSSGHDEVRKYCALELVFVTCSVNTYFSVMSLCKHSIGCSFDLQARLLTHKQRLAAFAWQLVLIFFLLNISLESLFEKHFPAVVGVFIFGLLVFRSAVAYLCGHLHTLGGLMPVLHSRHPQGTLELELGDWMDNRRYGKQQNFCFFHFSCYYLAFIEIYTAVQPSHRVSAGLKKVSEGSKRA